MSDTHVGFLNGEIERIQNELDAAKEVLSALRALVKCPEGESLLKWMIAREQALAEVVRVEGVVE